MDEITKSAIFNEIIEIKDRVNKLSQTFAEAVNDSITINKKLRGKRLPLHSGTFKK